MMFWAGDRCALKIKGIIYLTSLIPILLILLSIIVVSFWAPAANKRWPTSRKCISPSSFVIGQRVPILRGKLVGIDNFPNKELSNISTLDGQFPILGRELIRIAIVNFPFEIWREHSRMKLFYPRRSIDWNVRETLAQFHGNDLSMNGNKSGWGTSNVFAHKIPVSLARALNLHLEPWALSPNYGQSVPASRFCRQFRAICLTNQKDQSDQSYANSDDRCPEVSCIEFYVRWLLAVGSFVITCWLMFVVSVKERCWLGIAGGILFYFLTIGLCMIASYGCGGWQNALMPFLRISKN